MISNEDDFDQLSTNQQNPPQPRGTSCDHYKQSRPAFREQEPSMAQPVPIEDTGVLEVTDEALRIADGWYDLHEKHLSRDRRQLWEHARQHLRHSESSKVGIYNHYIGKLATDRPDWIYVALLKVLYSVDKLNSSKVGMQIRERCKHMPRTLQLDTAFVKARGFDNLAQSKKATEKEIANKLQLKARHVDATQQTEQEMEAFAMANSTQQKPAESTDQLGIKIVELARELAENHCRQKELREELHGEELAGKKLAMDIANVAQRLSK